MIKSAGGSSCPIHGVTTTPGNLTAPQENILFFPVEKVTRKDLEKAGGKMRVTVNDENLALIMHGTKVYAVQEKCPHNGGPLYEGDIEEVPSGGGLCIKCPWHSWKFNLVSGKCVSPSNRGTKVMKTFPTRLDATGQIISVGFDRIAPSIFTQDPL